MFSLTAIVDNLLESRGSDAEGRHCQYFQVTDKIGLKTYEYKGRFEEAYEWQQKLHNIGLAPETYGDFIHISPEGETIYCFLTEHCEPCGRQYDNDDNEYEDDILIKIQILVMQVILSSYGFRAPDLYGFNVGYNQNGEFIVLDTGDIRSIDEDSVKYYIQNHCEELKDMIHDQYHCN